MAYVDKRLLKAAAAAGNKLQVALGESIRATYIGYDTKMDEKYNKLRYQFKWKLADGTEKLLSTSAGKVLKKMARIAPGSLVEITKLGEQQQTDYDFDILKEPKVPVVQRDEEEVIEAEQPEDEEEEEDDDEEEAGELKANF